MPQSSVIQVPHSSRRSKQRSIPTAKGQFDDALLMAKEQGLLSGGRTLTIRGRMPSMLVQRAKAKTGIQSDSKLLEAALANIVAMDEYAEWLFAQRGTIKGELDLEF